MRYAQSFTRTSSRKLPLTLLRTILHWPAENANAVAPSSLLTACLDSTVKRFPRCACWGGKIHQISISRQQHWCQHYRLNMNKKCRQDTVQQVQCIEELLHLLYNIVRRLFLLAENDSLIWQQTVWSLDTLSKWYTKCSCVTASSNLPTLQRLLAPVKFGANNSFTAHKQLAVPVARARNFVKEELSLSTFTHLLLADMNRGTNHEAARASDTHYYLLIRHVLWTWGHGSGMGSRITQVSHSCRTAPPCKKKDWQKCKILLHPGLTQLHLIVDMLQLPVQKPQQVQPALALHLDLCVVQRRFYMS